MDFREELKKAAEEAVQKQRNAADHALRQAFYEGVRFYMEYAHRKTNEPNTTS